MTTTADLDTHLESHIETLATILDLTIAPEWREAVMANMATIAQAARFVIAYPLEDHDEAAPVFRA